MKTASKDVIGHIFASLLKASVAVSLTLLFVACGDDSGSSADTPDKVEFVSSIYNLGDCTKDSEGDTVFVKDEKADFVCLSGKWVNVDSLDSRLREDDENSSSSVIPGNDPESSSSLIDDPLCGDCNSSSSVSATYIEVLTKDKLASCDSSNIGLRALVLADSSYHICKEKGWAKDSVYLGYILVANRENLPICNEGNIKQRAYSKKDSLFFFCDTSKWEPEIADGYIVKNVSLLGAAQKGPFKFDSPLQLREVLLRNDSLIYSGRKHVDEISSNKGDFVIPKVNLIYPYAVLEVRGLWRNEVSGEYSRDSMTLRVLTDLSKRTEVNINLLTHLEYDRAAKLVSKGYSVYAAKKQADYEIMTAFGFATSVEYSEDLKTFTSENYAENATLMAISLLFIGDRSEIEIQSAIGDFKSDIADDGEWNNGVMKANMADWAESFDGSLVRANVKSWNILDIPDYESYLTVFWNNAYGLGGCGQNRYGIVTPVTNNLSKNYNVHYKCEVMGWRKATDFEKDTYGWDDGEEGEVKKGDVTATYYVFESGAWTVATNETALGLCSEGRNGEIGKIETVYYICDNKAWRVATILEYDTDGFGVGDDGEVRVGKVNNDKYYVYENGAWRASANEIENNLGACVTSRLNEVSKSGSTYYTCKSNGWVTSTAIEYDTYQWTAGAEGEMKPGSVNSSNHYTYADGAWRATTNDVEYEFGACVVSRSNEKHIQNGKYYICENKAWKQITAEEYGLGYCTASNSGVVELLNGVYYTCKSDAWTTATVLEYDTYGFGVGGDGEVRVGKVNKNRYYVYENGAWRASANEIENNLGACVASRSGEKQILNGKYYICENGDWKQITSEEYGLGYCTASNSGVVELLNGVYYICKLDAWVVATMLEYDTYGFGLANDGEVRVGRINKNKYYVYENGVWRASANEIENNLGACVNGRDGEKNYLNNNYFICKNSAWNEVSLLEFDTYGLRCFSDGRILNGDVFSENKYVCDEEKFKEANEVEIELGKGCVSYNDDMAIRKRISKEKDSTYVCENKRWIGTSVVVYDLFVDGRDNQVYRSVDIGNKTWMAENLNYADSAEYPSMLKRHWCYENDTDNCAKYGRLYTWSAAIDSVKLYNNGNGIICGNRKTCIFSDTIQGICPNGWHLPDSTEWHDLIDDVGGKSIAGKNLKSQTVDWGNGAGLDIASFSILPSGMCCNYNCNNGYFANKGGNTWFWSATDVSYSSGTAWVFGAAYNKDSAERDFSLKDIGHPVRCVKNN